MFSLFEGCCRQSSGISCFETAYEKATYPDWNSPQQNDVNYIIEVMKGKNQHVSVNIGLNMLLINLQRNYQMDITLQIKTLFILDQVVDQFGLVNKISNYSNHRFSDFDLLKYQKNSQRYIHQEFIRSYFHYIKSKANLYKDYDQKLFLKKKRKIFIAQMPPQMCISLIKGCMDLQGSVIKLNKIFQQMQRVYKQSQLMRKVSVWVLKNHLQLYGIILRCFLRLIGIKQNLEPKIQKAHQIKNLANRFNRQYVIKFIQMIHQNDKQQGFQNVKFTQIQPIPEPYIVMLNQMLMINIPQLPKYQETTDIFNKNIPEQSLDLDKYEEINIRKNSRKLINLNSLETINSDLNLFTSYNNNYFSDNEEIAEYLRQSQSTSNDNQLNSIIQKPQITKFNQRQQIEGNKFQKSIYDLKQLQKDVMKKLQS